MEKLSKLIEKLCPNGVEYKPLWSLTAWDKRFIGVDKLKQKKIISYKYYFSSNFDKVERENGNIKYISTGISIKERFTTEELAKDYLAEGEIICIPGGGTPNVKYHKGKFVTGDNRIATSLDTSILNNKFLYYFMQTNIETISSFYRGTAIKHPNMKSILDMYIPVPPLDIQNEIVRILDNYTKLQSELEKKIDAEFKYRQQQYNFYMNKIFKKYVSNIMELASIGEVTKLAGFEFTKYVNYSDEGKIIALRGLNVKNGKILLDDVKYIDNSDFSKLNRSRLYKNDILYTYVGTVGQVGLVDCDNKYYLAPNVARIRIIDTKVLPEFVMYFLQTNEFKLNQLDKLSAVSSMKNITIANIRKFKISIPSLEKQEIIVKILNNFNKLYSNIMKNLSSEMKLTQKQYKYYRDKLLNFKELKSID